MHVWSILPRSLLNELFAALPRAVNSVDIQPDCQCRSRKSTHDPREVSPVPERKVKLLSKLWRMPCGSATCGLGRQLKMSGTLKEKPAENFGEGSPVEKNEVLCRPFHIPIPNR